MWNSSKNSGWVLRLLEPKKFENDSNGVFIFGRCTLTLPRFFKLEADFWSILLFKIWKTMKDKDESNVVIEAKVALITGAGGRKIPKLDCHSKIHILSAWKMSVRFEDCSRSTRNKFVRFFETMNVNVICWFSVVADKMKEAKDWNKF